MLKKTILLCLLGFIGTYSGFCQQDSRAQSILIEAYNKYKTYQNIKINFSCLTENKSANLRQIQEGTAYINGLRHVIELPEKDIISDGKTIWTYLKDSKKVFVSSYDPNDGKITPDEIFREDFLSQGLRYSYVDQSHQSNRGALLPAARAEEIIDFYPMDKNRNYLCFRLFIDQETHLITHWRVFMKNGSTIDYQLNITPNIEVANSFFEYSPYRFPDIKETIDLRKRQEKAQK